MVACGIAAAASWLLYFNYSDDLKPYDMMMFIFAVSMSAFVGCTFCCTLTTINREYFDKYFFVVLIIFFAFYCLLVSVFGFIVLKYNTSIPFYDVSDTMKELLVWAYFAGGMLGFIFLLGSGLSGLQLNSLTQENYFAGGGKKRVQWCPDCSPDMEKLEYESAARKAKRLADLPGSDLYGDDFAYYRSSFQGIIDLQQARNDHDEVNHFLLEDLVDALPQVPKDAIDGPRCSDRTVDFQPIIRDKACRGRLLPDKQLRGEHFFRAVWGTSLALALLRERLPQWCEEEDQSALVRRGLDDEVQVAIFNRIVTETTIDQEKDWAEKQAALDAAKKKPMDSAGEAPVEEEAAEEAVEEEAGEGEEEEVEEVAVDVAEEGTKYDINEQVFWKKDIRLAVMFLNNALQGQRRKNPDLRSDARDWLAVAEPIVKDWLSSKKKK